MPQAEAYTASDLNPEPSDPESLVSCLNSLNEEYNELRQSLRQEDKEVLKRSEQQWLKWGNAESFGYPSEYLRMTVEGLTE